MNLIQKASKLGYKHYTEFTVEEIDNLPLGNSNKQIEYYFLQKWLREVHHISIKIDDFYTDGKIRFDYCIGSLGSQEDNPRGIFESYEEALEKGLQEALKLIR